MKNITFFLLLIFGFLANGQDSKKLYAKGNALFLPVGMLNAGLEYRLSSKYSLQGDVFVSPWKSFAGKHAQVYMGHLEGRYYFDEVFKKWYFGVNAGAGVFDVNKWNHFAYERFQRGYNFMLGAVVGYQFQWKDRWNIDVFLGGGTVQSYYHGYEEVPPNFIRYDGAEKWNRSGEFLPYRGGIMIAYKIF